MSEEFATGSTAVRDVERGVGIVSGLYEKGLLVWRE
jgi:arylesterase/paraoxonase